MVISVLRDWTSVLHSLWGFTETPWEGGVIECISPCLTLGHSPALASEILADMTWPGTLDVLAQFSLPAVLLWLAGKETFPGLQLVQGENRNMGTQPTA